MFRRKSIFSGVVAASVLFSSVVSAASISISDAIRDFSSEEAELKSPLAGEDVPDTDRSVMNIGDTPVVKAPPTGSDEFQLEEVQPDFFQIDDSTLFGKSDRMMNEDGSTASIPFQL